ncbi:MAG: hypothetical protein ACW963_04435 [Candidatus Sifarchaeia archaeon]
MLSRFLGKNWFLLVPFMAIATGCLSPATIRPVANQNSNNIANYNANVVAINNALRREASFHGDLEIQIARNKLARDLIQLPKKWLGPPSEPTSHDLADPSKEPYISLKTSVEKARVYRAEISKVLENEESINTAMATKYPLVAHIVMDTPGFSVIRVLEDAFTLKKLNSQIINVIDPEIHEGLMGKRNRLLDSYMPVQIRIDLVQTYLYALEEYLSIVTEQGQVAASHANSISAYAQAKPQVTTLASALRDQELRVGVLELVKNKKGENYARRVENYLDKADNFIGVVTRLAK